ncbi:MAG: GNAT family N-acetyltransferase [Cetobacterium sp.]
MEVLHNKDKSLFYIKNEDNKTIGKLSYAKEEENTVIIEHTLVHDIYKGKGIGNILMDEAVKYFRENNWNVIPECSFAKFIFDKYPEKYKDIVKK